MLHPPIKVGSTFDLQYAVENVIREHIRENRRNLWDELVESSINIDAFDCNDFLLREVEIHTGRFLNQMSDSEMRRICHDTESGIMTIEQGFDEIDRSEMIRDIAIDINQGIASEVCRAAQEIMKKKRHRQKKA